MPRPEAWASWKGAGVGSLKAQPQLGVRHFQLVELTDWHWLHQLAEQVGRVKVALVGWVEGSELTWQVAWLFGWADYRLDRSVGPAVPVLRQCEKLGKSGCSTAERLEQELTWPGLKE